MSSNKSKTRDGELDERSQTIVLCIDRDNDIGRKAKMNGPIIGIEANSDAVLKLGSADPEDSDVNAILGGIKIAKDRNLQLATITGDIDRGYEADKNIRRQLKEISEKFKPKSAILVTDGADDQQVIPLIYNYMEIAHTETVIVRQTQELEKIYLTIVNYIFDRLSNPRLTFLMFGLPGIALILLSLFGSYAWKFIMFVSGFYLLIHAFGYEHIVRTRLRIFLASFSRHSISVLAYATSLVIFFIAFTYGYEHVIGIDSAVHGDSNIIKVFTFISGASNLLLFGIVVALFGRMIGQSLDPGTEVDVRGSIITIVLAVLILGVVSSGNEFIQGHISFSLFATSIAIYFAILIIAYEITKYFFDSTESMIMGKYMIGMDVYNSMGNFLGEAVEVAGDSESDKTLKLDSGKIIKKDDIKEVGERIIVKGE